jgi:hypothetical protein
MAQGIDSQGFIISMELESFLFITTEFKTSPALASEELSLQTGVDKLF